MELKYWNRGLLGLVAILLFLAVLILLKVLFSGSGKMEWGSVSDWVSTVLNGIVACTAVFALKKANNFFQEKLTEEDISLWLQINTSVSAIASTVTTLWVLYYRMVQEWQETKDLEILRQHYMFYITPLNDFTCQLNKLDEFNYRLDTRKQIYDKREHLQKLIRELNEFNRVTLNKIDDIQTILKYSFNIDSHNISKKSRDSFIATANKNIRNIYVMNEQLQHAYEIFKDFGIDDHHINGIGIKKSL